MSVPAAADPAAVDNSRTYQVHAETDGTGLGTIHTKQAVVRFDSSPAQGNELPGPADLLTSAFAACIIKNVERMGEMLPFTYQHAAVSVTAERQDRPPKVVRITYALTLVTDEPEKRVELLHRNIQRHGTIFNTLAETCEISGTINALPSR